MQGPILFDAPAPKAQAHGHSISIRRSQLRRLVGRQQRQLYRDYVTACLRGRRLRKIEYVETLPLPVGHIVKGTDCDYVVEPAGNWRRIQRSGPHLPPGKTNIYLRDPDLTRNRKPLADSSAGGKEVGQERNGRPQATA